MHLRKYKPEVCEGFYECEEGGCPKTVQTGEECEEKDCNMECDGCGNSPKNTKEYTIIEGKNNSYQLCDKCVVKLKTMFTQDIETEQKKRMKNFNNNHKCLHCKYSLYKRISNSGNEYWRCNLCNSTFTPDGKTDYYHTKWSQDDFTYDKPVVRR